MKLIIVRLTLTTLFLYALSIHGFAGQLDDFYLKQFGVTIDSPPQKSVLLSQVENSDTPHCGTPLKHGLRRDWIKLEPATQKLLAKQLAAPVLSGKESTLLSPSGRFKIHYTTSGFDAVPSINWVQTVAQTFDDVASAYLGLGWRLAPTISAEPYDVYLLELAYQKLYGQTTSSQAIPSAGFSNAYGSFMEIDNNFTEKLYENLTGGPYSPTQSLQITAAHEYQHAIQYGYNYFFDIWYAEATSTWYEDELYGGVNQLYNYIPAWFSNSNLSLDTTTSTNTGGGYSRWLFDRYLAEQHGTSVVRNAWEKLAGLSPSTSQTNIYGDISMVPVLENLLVSAPYNSSLGADFFGFSRRVYLRDWASHTDEIDRIHSYIPNTTLENYPANNLVTLDHYSFYYFKFTPSSLVPTLIISLNKTSGIQSAVFKKVGGVISDIPFNSSSKSFTVNGFGSMDSTADEVVLLVANITNTDGHQASLSTNGNTSSVTEPPNNVAASTNGGGSGCFIATAAYGSYLHPQVQILRNFRDHFLLTNAPGRAFVALYYQISPPLADFIARHELLRGLTRVILTPVIVAAAHPAPTGISLLVVMVLYLPRRRRSK